MHPVLSTLVALTGLTGTAIASPPPAAPVPATPVCGEARLAVYFEDGSQTLTPQAETAIAAVTDSLEGCAVSKISVRTAHIHDATGAADQAAARGAVVRQALADTGLATPGAPVIESPVAYASTDAAALMPLARRVDVRIEAVSPGAVG